MSMQNKIIAENLPKLIKSLTGFNDTDENYQICHRFAITKFQNHKYLSVNSHEIRRRIDDLSERMSISNYQKYVTLWTTVSQLFINHPICINHYETDIQWSLLLFLLETSHNPVAALTYNTNAINLSRINLELNKSPDHSQLQQRRTSKEELIELLRLDNIETINKLAISNCSSFGDGGDFDDEFSDTSSDGELNDKDNKSIWKSNLSMGGRPLSSTINPINNLNSINDIQPPKPLEIYKDFDGSGSMSWLLTNVQQINLKFQPKSQHENANFGRFWNDKTIPNQINRYSSENLLIKEICLMFFEPTNGIFFLIDRKTLTITVRDDVSINSLSAKGLSTFLKVFAEHMTIVLRLQEFCNSIGEYKEISRIDSIVTADKTPLSYRPPSHSYECYVNGIKELLKPLYDFLIEKYAEITNQNALSSTKVCSLIKLYHELELHFQILQNLNKIHLASTLNYKENPAHICSIYLLSSLLEEFNHSSNMSYLNLVIALFLKVIKIYFYILDEWWVDGRLTDCRREFIIKNKITNTITGNDTFDQYEICMLSKNPDKLFFINETIGNLIEQSLFTKLLSKHLLQTGYALNILQSLDRISEIKSETCFKENLYETFVNMFFIKSKKFTMFDQQNHDHHHQQQQQQQSTTNRTDQINNSSLSGETTNNLLNGIIFDLKNDDEMLFFAFESTIKASSSSSSISIPPQTPIPIHSDDTNEIDSSTPQNTNNAFELYQRLEKLSEICLPFEEIILNCMSELLMSRITVANVCVTKLYKIDYQIIYHLQNIRKVYLLEASDLLYKFYSSLFEQIESNTIWNNSYLLTDQLNGVLRARWPEMSALFCVKVPSKNYTNKTVLNVIDDITVNYTVQKKLQNIISDDILSNYNKVFRFLLKIKWGLWTLENLRFPLQQKCRQPYKRLNICDLKFKRLAMVRIWILYSLQCVHTHLMTHVLQSMGDKLDSKIENSKNLWEIIDFHNSYIKTIYDHCFLNKTDIKIYSGIENLLTLIEAVKNEWLNCETLIKYDGDDADEMDYGAGDSDEVDQKEELFEIEQSYINCHAFLATTVSSEVYMKSRSNLSGLSAAFSCSVPY